MAEGLLSTYAAWGSILSTVTKKKIQAREKMNMLTDLAGENHILSWKCLQFRSINKKIIRTPETSKRTTFWHVVTQL